jgi:hypothetical protein
MEKPALVAIACVVTNMLRRSMLQCKARRKQVRKGVHCENSANVSGGVQGFDLPNIDVV